MTDTRRFITAVEGVAAAKAPISHAVVVGNQCWISGQLSVDESGTYWPGTIREEATRAFEAIFRIAQSSGFTPDEIVYVDIAFKDLSDVGEVNAIYAGLFAEGRRPARTIYQAAALPMGGKVKVQAVAARG